MGAMISRRLLVAYAFELLLPIAVLLLCRWVGGAAN
jgi:hypothetical protein